MPSNHRKIGSKNLHAAPRCERQEMVKFGLRKTLIVRPGDRGLIVDGAALANEVFTIPLTVDLSDEIFTPLDAAPAPVVPAHTAAATKTKAVRSVNGNGKAYARTFPFFAGPEHRLLSQAVTSVLEDTPSPYNPLVIYGPPGTGKTHIARGIARRWATEGRGRVVVATAGDFARSFAAALEENEITTWRSRVRAASLLVVEDVNQLVAKQSATTELLHTFDALHSHGCQVVLTSRLPLEGIADLPHSLESRLRGGLLVSMPHPTVSTRLAILEHFAQAQGYDLPNAAARILADGLKATAPELFGALAELSAQQDADGQPITAESARRAVLRHRGRLQPSLKTITALAAKYFGISVAEMTSPTRRRAVVQARNIAIYLGREVIGKTLDQLGQYFGGRDHTTVLHGYRTIDARQRTDPAVRRALEDLRRMLASAS
jgi:chromosomal replication initiator protein